MHNGKRTQKFYRNSMPFLMRVKESDILKIFNETTTSKI